MSTYEVFNSINNNNDWEEENDGGTGENGDEWDGENGDWNGEIEYYEGNEE